MLLYETLSQPLIFLVVFGIGFGCGFVFDLRNYIHFLCNKNKIVGIVLDVISSIVCCLIFLLSVLNFNFGQVRFYLILSFILGLILQRFSLGYIIAKFFIWCYNLFKKVILKINYGKPKKKQEKTINN